VNTGCFTEVLRFIDNMDGSESDSETEETLCNSCKRVVTKENVLTCVLCDGRFHKSCVIRLKNTKQLTNDKVICCASRVEPETSLCCIIGLVKDLESKKTELKLIEKLMNEIQEKNKLLEQKIASMEESKLKYSDIVKSKPSNCLNPDIPSPKVATVILKPKQSQSSEKTRKDLQTNINPEELQIAVKSIHPTRNGGLAINCISTNDANKLVEEIQNKLDSYNVNLPQLNNPKIKIIGYQPKEHEDNATLEQKIINQNDLRILNGKLKISYIGKNARQQPIIFAETSPNLFRILMHRKKLYIGWERFPVYEDISIGRCRRCQAYGHKQNKCTGNFICSYCSGPHEFKNCPKESKKCINCDTVNKKYQLNHAVQHEANDSQCPTYIFQVKRHKSRINYAE
jgi:hypothetical protein